MQSSLNLSPTTLSSLSNIKEDETLFWFRNKTNKNVNIDDDNDEDARCGQGKNARFFSAVHDDERDPHENDDENEIKESCWLSSSAFLQYTHLSLSLVPTCLVFFLQWMENVVSFKSACCCVSCSFFLLRICWCNSKIRILLCMLLDGQQQVHCIAVVQVCSCDVSNIITGWSQACFNKVESDGDDQQAGLCLFPCFPYFVGVYCIVESSIQWFWIIGFNLQQSDRQNERERKQGSVCNPSRSIPLFFSKKNFFRSTFLNMYNEKKSEKNGKNHYHPLKMFRENIFTYANLVHKKRRWW